MGGDEAGAVRHRGGFVAGLGERYAVTEHRGVQRGVQVDLTPTGARRLLGLPLSELDGRVVALRDLLGSDARRLSERLGEEPRWERRLDLLEAVLIRRIQAADRLDTRKVDWALSRIEGRAGNLAIGSLARELGHSRRHLNALFQDQVGVGPKLWARLVRFSGVIQRARSAPERPWAELALAHGYYDQAHLVREVRHFTGLTPTLARQSYTELAELLE
jgi:AraC-like DNA-binding protein